MKKIIWLFIIIFLLLIFKNYIIIESFIIAATIFFIVQYTKKNLNNCINNIDKNKETNNIISESTKSRKEDINYLKELRKSLIETKNKEKQKVYKK